MLDLTFDYASCVRGSEKVSWRLDDVMPADTNLDFSRPFLPEALAGATRVPGLDPQERKTLNQISGNAYLNLFQFVEEYILAAAVQQTHAELFGDHEAVRALLRFAEEEAKHQQLFWRYREAFDRGVGKPCEVLGSATEVARVILSKGPLAVTMVTCHLELMTLQHYTECVRDDTGVDPLFSRLLKFHWLEESQHAKIDALELDKLASRATPSQIDAAFDDYLGICGAFDELLAKQADLDVASLATLTGRTFSDAEAKEIRASQHASYRKTFLWYGMTNGTFQQYLAKLSTHGAKRVAERAATLA